jgi:hypothetical protein
VVDRGGRLYGSSRILRQLIPSFENRSRDGPDGNEGAARTGMGVGGSRTWL